MDDRVEGEEVEGRRALLIRGGIIAGQDVRMPWDAHHLEIIPQRARGREEREGIGNLD